jgi:hypothetical protein
VSLRPEGVLWGVAILLTAVTGCANGEEGSPGEPYSVEMVRNAFEDETGDELIVEDEARDVPIIGDATLLGVRSGLDDKYGDFGITVFHGLGNRKRAQLGYSADIRWEYHPPESQAEVPYWTASRWEGNVALTWYHDTRQATEQWEQLDRVLRRLASK